MPGVDDVRIIDDPDPDLLARVEALLGRAVAVDLSPPLNEAALLALKHPERADTSHRVALDGQEPVGYAQLSTDGTGQLFVDPLVRRHGTGRLLLGALLDAARRQGVQLRVWALGDSPAAHALAARSGLVPVRTLLIMRRSLSDLPEPVVPAGITITPFRVGADEQAWLTVNARAFAHHPEQGSIDAEDLAERMREPWFDPAGFFLARASGDPDGRVLGFHWTKEHGIREQGVQEQGVRKQGVRKQAGRLGEVYVLGVDPEAQGRGLAKALLLTGLAHLRDRGNEVVELYVEADQPGPVGLYRSYGFTDVSRDVMYAGPTSAS